MEIAYCRSSDGDRLSWKSGWSLLAIEVRSRPLTVEARMKFEKWSTIVEIWMESGYYRSPATEEARSLMKFGESSESIVAGRSLEEIRRIVDHCRESAESEVQRAFGAVR